MNAKLVCKFFVLLTVVGVVSIHTCLSAAHETGRKHGHLNSGTTSTGGVSAGSSSGTSQGGRAGSTSVGRFTCLKVGSERGGIYSMISNTGITMLSPLEYDACQSATRDLNQGRFTCIRISRGADPQYALASPKQIISSPLRYDACLNSARELNQ